MWSFDYRRDTILWILGLALVIGLGVRTYEFALHRAANLPLLVTGDDAEAVELRRLLDSVRQAQDALALAPLNINAATAADLETLDGIGPVLALRIVTYREQHGPFRAVDDLLSVSGIGPKRLAALRARCFVDTAAAAVP